MSQTRPDAKPPPAHPAGPKPLIPEHVLDVPSQRLYYLSLGLLCQVRALFWFAMDSEVPFALLHSAAGRPMVFDRSLVTAN